jgi:hypothetical protein
VLAAQLSQILVIMPVITAISGLVQGVTYPVHHKERSHRWVQLQHDVARNLFDELEKNRELPGQEKLAPSVNARLVEVVVKVRSIDPATRTAECVFHNDIFGHHMIMIILSEESRVAA